MVGCAMEAWVGCGSRCASKVEVSRRVDAIFVSYVTMVGPSVNGSDRKGSW